ncbi:MAG: hypothetical protein KatS3mg031_0374 [Chitinophagales bacterium]|nr:MAG: hypothetical protein KatS3mg031_0374 [Chitinophagales bacterium]
MRGQTFTEVGHQAGISAYSYNVIGGGAAMFDYNNDGWLDIYITGGNDRDYLYRNNGDGTFTEVGIAAGLAVTGSYSTAGVTTGDIDNDGFRDVFVTTWGGVPTIPGQMRANLLFRNNGNGTFANISNQAGITHAAWSVTATMGDYNLDGFLDIYVANYVDSVRMIQDSSGTVIGFAHTGYNNFLYINNGNNTFTESAARLRVNHHGTALSAIFTDFDNDHDLDLYVANDFGQWVEPNVLYRNEFPADSFTDVSAPAGANVAIYAMGIAAGDYNEDGYLDYYITNIGRNVLLRNRGNGTFDDMTDSAGVADTFVDSAYTSGWGTGFFDFNNDTYLDIYVCNGLIPAAPFIYNAPKNPDKLFKNNGDGTFTDVSLQAGVSDSLVGRGLTIGDYDNDGDLDALVVITSTDIPTSVRSHLYRNESSSGTNWLKVSLQGTLSNRDGYGSRIELYFSNRRLIREIDGGSSHASQHSSIAHFGLGNHTRIDSILVIWPGGRRQTIDTPAVNQHLHIVENGSAYTVSYLSPEICQGDSFFIGHGYKTIAGIYFDTVDHPGLKDTIYITRLRVSPKSEKHLSFTLCHGDSILVGGSYRHTSGTYYDSLTGHNGCDSVLITHLVVHPIIQTTRHVTLCPNDSIWAGGAWQKDPGIYADTFSSFTGCDSVLLTQIFVETASFISQHVHICEGDSFFAGGNFQFADGIFYDTITNLSGCDSITETQLTFLPSYLLTRDTTLAPGDSIFAGGTWQHMPGIYYDTLHASNGCDSLIVTSVSVISTVGQTAQKPGWSVFPNPSSGYFEMRFPMRKTEMVHLTVWSPDGIVYLSEIIGPFAPGWQSIQVNTSGLPSGVIFIRAMTSETLRQIQLILTK